MLWKGTAPAAFLAALLSARAGAAGAAPVVLFVHGGGFRIGDKRVGENIAAYFARAWTARGDDALTGSRRR